MCAALLIVFGASVSAAEKEYIFSAVPWGNADEIKAMMQPLLDHIEEKTGAKFKTVMFPTYDDLVDEVMGGYVQFAQLNAVTYLNLMHKNADINYVATSIRSFGEFERDYYLGYIFTRKDSPLESFDDLKDKIFAFVDDTSSSGYKMPVAYMKSRNLDPKTYFRKYFFMGDHDEVAKAVANQKVAAGATWEASYTLNQRRYDDLFKIIFETPPIPNDAWIVGNSVPDNLTEKIKKVLLETNIFSYTSDGRKVLDQDLGIPEVGFAERNSQFYEDAAPLLLSDFD